MSNFKVPRMDDPDYRKWVASLPCANCGNGYKSHAHHRIGHGRVSTMKVDDYETMPLCATCHGLLHGDGWFSWEPENRTQHAMTVETLIQALRQEVLIPNVPMLKRMAKYGRD